MTRGRPPQFDRDQALLDAARLFWARGFSGTSTRALTSVIEFTQDPAEHPGCMVTSAIMTDSADELTDYVQTVWHGLSAQSNHGVDRDRLLRSAEIATHHLWE